MEIENMNFHVCYKFKNGVKNIPTKAVMKFV